MDGYLDVGHLVVFVLLAPIPGVGLAVVVPRLWRMKADRPPPKPRRWTLRRALRSSWIRTLPLNFVQLLVLELAGIAGFFEKLLSGAGGRVAGEATVARVDARRAAAGLADRDAFSIARRSRCRQRCETNAVRWSCGGAVETAL